MLVIASFVPMIFDATVGQGTMAKSVFTGLGLRAENATVRLNGSALSSVKDAARNLDVDLAVCSDEDGNATVSPLNVIWHGMGKRSLVSMPKFDDKKDITRSTEVEVSSGELHLIRGNNTRCFDLASRVFFESNKSDVSQKNQVDKLIEEAKKDIETANKMLCELPKEVGSSIAKKCQWNLSQILVSGSADSMPKSDGGNEELAQKRAKSVIDVFLKDSQFSYLPSNVFKSESLGSRMLQQKTCPYFGDTAVLQECHSSNRNVKVRLLFLGEPIPVVQNQKK
jgi:outer membrane protein OmpA-like peptidoglycan-associated protein